MSNSGSRSSKIGWTQQEQSLLETLCKSQKKSDWKSISCEINTMFPTKNRSSKQCRQRFNNYIKFKGQNTHNLNWTQEEDEKLFKIYIQVGSKWAEISKKISGRSENSIKNRFYGKLRKFVRVINQIPKNSLMKIRKPIKQQMIIKILSKSELHISSKYLIENGLTDSQNFLEKLKYDLLTYILQYQTAEFMEEILIDVVNRIHIYNSITKSQNIKQNRMGKLNKRKRLPPIKNFINKNIEKIKKNQSLASWNQIFQETLKDLAEQNNKQSEKDPPSENRMQDILIQLSSLQEGIECQRQAFNRGFQHELGFIFQRNSFQQKYDYFQLD